MSEQTALQVQELDTGKEIWRVQAPSGDSFRSLAFSPDGKTVASGSESGQLTLWEAASGKEVRRITLRQPVDAVAFSPDGTRIASGGDLMARLWDVATGKEIVSYPTHDGAVDSFAFSPDEKRIASTSDDGVLRHWDVATGKELHEFPLPRRGLTGPLAFSRDGRVVTWATSTWDGKEGTVQSWEVESGKQVRRVTLEASEPLRPESLSPDVTMIAGAGEKDVLRSWTRVAGKVFAQGHPAARGRLTFSSSHPTADGSRPRATGGAVEIWETPALQLVRQFSASRDSVLSLAFSPDGTNDRHRGCRRGPEIVGRRNGERTLALAAPALIPTIALYAPWHSVLMAAKSPGAATIEAFGSGTFQRVASFVNFTAIRTE